MGTGVGFPQVKKIVVEREADEILNQYAGAGHGTKRGFINLVFDEDAPPPSELSPEEIDSHILGVILANQYNLKKGKELFGDRCDKAVMDELSEIDGLETYEPQRIEDLTYETKKRALESLLLISEKRADQDGKSKRKGRCVAVGSKQRSYDGYEKSDGSSPTVITDSIFLAGVIEANENRAMSTIDVGNAFIQADNDERILMLLRGKVAELMVRVNPTLYRPYITYSKNEFLRYM